jgi:hypothetical protein
VGNDHQEKESMSFAGDANQSWCRWSMNMKPDQEFLNLLLSSSCFGRECCALPPCACAQSLIDLCVAKFMQRLQDHYWDSFAQDKELILKHVRGALTAGQ